MCAEFEDFSTDRECFQTNELFVTLTRKCSESVTVFRKYLNPQILPYNQGVHLKIKIFSSKLLKTKYEDSLCQDSL